MLSTNKLVDSDFDNANHSHPLSNKESFEKADSDVNLVSDTPQNSPIGDSSQLFDEFAILRQCKIV